MIVAHILQQYKITMAAALLHTVKGFCVVEVDVFLELSGFLHNPAHVSNLVSSSSAPLKSNLYFWEVLHAYLLFLLSFDSLL